MYLAIYRYASTRFFHIANRVYYIYLSFILFYFLPKLEYPIGAQEHARAVA